MTLAQFTPIRGLLLFAIVWIAATYFFEVFSHMLVVGAGFAAAVAAWLIGMYFRKQALRAVEANWKFHLWTSLPPLLFVLTPAVIQFVRVWRSGEPVTWGSIGWALMPFVLKVLVPCVALGWAWLALAPPADQPAAEHGSQEEVA